MAGELVSRNDLRMSDADRERVVERLRAAVGEGRLTLDEFEQRLDAVLTARTFGEVEPYVADLPAVPVPKEHVQVRATSSGVKRRGQWVVPRQLSVFNKSSSVTLDFTEAVLAHRVVHIELDCHRGSTTLVLPPGATVTTDEVEMVRSSVSVRKVPVADLPGATGVHFVVRGKQKSSSLLVRHQRRFWRWRW
ncbi:MAG TPA: DUF1707 domain-containing protein [Micromonosporaceae bacterium]|nr:DUF1707 domain-containing protein [Micromonosporaceae bacterium]